MSKLSPFLFTVFLLSLCCSSQASVEAYINDIQLNESAFSMLMPHSNQSKPQAFVEQVQGSFPDVVFVIIPGSKHLNSKTRIKLKIPKESKRALQWYKSKLKKIFSPSQAGLYLNASEEYPSLTSRPLFDKPIIAIRSNASVAAIQHELIHYLIASERDDSKNLSAINGAIQNVQQEIKNAADTTQRNTLNTQLKSLELEWHKMTQLEEVDVTSIMLRYKNELKLAPSESLEQLEYMRLNYKAKSRALKKLGQFAANNNDTSRDELNEFRKKLSHTKVQLQKVLSEAQDFMHSLTQSKDR